MPISAHYGLTVLIWGLTWTAIRLQVEAATCCFSQYILAADRLDKRGPHRG